MAGKNPWDPRRVALQQSLRRLREAAGLLQEELADRLGKDQSFVSRFERGERRLDLVELDEIAAACGVDLARLVKLYHAAVLEQTAPDGGATSRRATARRKTP